jgi:xanthine dehydrogenase YagR molybdenum-binding subunit
VTTTSAAPGPDSARRSARIGDAVSRIDGRQRVTGSARYGADFPVAAPAHACLCTSTIAAGRIVDIDESEARSVAGVLDIFTYRNVGTAIKGGAVPDHGGQMEASTAPLESAQIHYYGQIVAVVVAEHYEQARDAASRLRFRYAARQPASTFGQPGLETERQADVKAGALEDPQVGNASSAYDAAPVKHHAMYATPANHHNPIEMYSTTCFWEDARLVVYESNRNVTGYRFALATQLGIRAEDVHVVSPFVGGCFGSRGFLTQRTAIVALVARRLKRPVKLEVTREQMFTIAAFRAEAQTEVRLGANRDGRLCSLTHYGWEITSRADTYRVGGAGVSTRVYACPNVESMQYVVRADRHTPGFMRSPPETPYLFGLESSMDELSYQLGMDPVELRRINDTTTDPINGVPITSRRLLDCYDAAAKAFDWSRRDPRPATMRDGDWVVGLGCASAVHTAQAAPASARVSLGADGLVTAQAAAHDIGGGLHTAVAITVSDILGVPIEQITVQLGDSDLPPSPLAGGSNSTTSVCNVVANACREIRERVIAAAITAIDSPLNNVDADSVTMRDNQLVGPRGAAEPIATAVARTTRGALEVHAEYVPHGAEPQALQLLYHGVTRLAGGVRLKDRVQCSYGANFVEVGVHRLTREIRVRRIVGAYAFGTVVNEKAARSQLIGAQIFGVSAALHEATELDLRTGGYTNANLAGYLIPVNADVPRQEALILPEHDHTINRLGTKGVGELGNCGMNAAIANAVYNATGVRIRKMPIRLEQVL